MKLYIAVHSLYPRHLNITINHIWSITSGRLSHVCWLAWLASAALCHAVCKEPQLLHDYFMLWCCVALLCNWNVTRSDKIPAWGNQSLDRLWDVWKCPTFRNLLAEFHCSFTTVLLQLPGCLPWMKLTRTYILTCGKILQGLPVDVQKVTSVTYNCILMQLAWTSNHFRFVLHSHLHLEKYGTWCYFLLSRAERRFCNTTAAFQGAASQQIDAAILTLALMYCLIKQDRSVWWPNSQYGDSLKSFWLLSS